MINKIKLFISRFTNTRIFKGYGVTIPIPKDMVIGKDLSIPDIDRELCFYKSTNAIVELLSIYRSRKGGKLIYKFRDLRTSKTFVICEDGFNILFDTNPLCCELNYTGLKK